MIFCAYFENYSHFSIFLKIQFLAKNEFCWISHYYGLIAHTFAVPTHWIFSKSMGVIFLKVLPKSHQKNMKKSSNLVIFWKNYKCSTPIDFSCQELFNDAFIFEKVLKMTEIWWKTYFRFYSHHHTLINAYYHMPLLPMCR